MSLLRGVCVVLSRQLGAAGSQDITGFSRSLGGAVVQV